MHPTTGHDSPDGEQRYTSTLSLKSAINTASAVLYRTQAVSNKLVQQECDWHSK